MLALVFVAMGVGHFVPLMQHTMVAMIPPRLRGRGLLSGRNLVIFTGLCEIAGGIGLLLSQTRLAAGICLLVFLIVVFPANVHAARNRERFGAAAFPLVPRLIFQLVLMALLVGQSCPLDHVETSGADAPAPSKRRLLRHRGCIRTDGNCLFFRANLDWDRP
ncbi:hypothetical protein [Cryobacterium sp. LW097]|uniref:DoxX family protein n=1 Tax=Cryobacterium sp. LW097 TaxID=1978566 RepID=UPI001F0C8802|nr:hypothetical protein [Cryobacterium sp. LW097]